MIIGSTCQPLCIEDLRQEVVDANSALTRLEQRLAAQARLD